MLEKLKTALRSQPAAGRDLQSEARYYSDLLSRKLEQLDICYRYRRNEKDFLEKGVRRVTFKLAVTQEEAIWLLIDTGPRKFPRGVSLADINKTEVLNDLGVAAQRPIRFKQGVDGAWLVVEREIGVFGIKEIGFGEMLENWPQNSRKELLLPFGLAANRRLIYESLVEFPHLLIGGATQAGKTTLTHAWICALILHTPPERLNLVLIDLKGGVEYTRYKGLPHVWTHEAKDGIVNGFVKDRSQAVPVLELLRWEMDRRLAMFEPSGVQNIAAWNHRHRSDPMPRIVVFIDELASLMLEPDLKKDAERILADLGARGRAPGIHLILATQRPEVSVVSGRIKGNIDGRACFRVPDNASSMVVLDDISGAQFPEDTPRGRFIYKFGNTRREIQGPWISPGVIKAKVDSVVDGDTDLQKAALPDPSEIFIFALEKFDGNFPIQKMFEALRGKGISNKYLRYIARTYEGELIELQGTVYTLLPPGPEFEPRKLVKADNAPATGDSEGHGHGDMDSGTQPGTQLAILGTQTTGVDAQPGTQTADTLMDHILEYAIAQLEGRLSIRDLAPVFRGKITKNDLVDALKEYENASVTINGKLYFCEPGVGRRPRRLICVEESHE